MVSRKRSLAHIGLYGVQTGALLRYLPGREDAAFHGSIGEDCFAVHHEWRDAFPTCCSPPRIGT